MNWRLLDKILFAVCFLVLIQSVVPHAMADVDEADGDKWEVMYYYIAPRPDSALKEITPTLMDDPVNEVARAATMVIVSFVARENAKLVDNWLGISEGVSDSGKLLVCYGLRLAGTPESLALLQQIRRELPDEYSQAIDSLVNQPAPNLLEDPIRSPARLDMLWAAFFMTGDERYVLKIVQTLPWLETGDDKNVNPILIGGAANWSTRALAWQHSRVLQILRNHIDDQPKELAKLMREIITEVEERLISEPCPEPSFDQ